MATTEDGPGAFCFLEGISLFLASLAKSEAESLSGDGHEAFH